MSTYTNTIFEFGVNHNGVFKLNPLTYQDGSIMNMNVPEMGFEYMVSYLKRKITRRFTTLYYTPPNNTLQGMKAIKNDYDTNVMYDIAKVAGKLQIYVSHHPIDLGTVLIPNDGSLEESFTRIIFEETKIKQQEALRYLHQMQKQNQRFDYYEFLGKLGFINKTKPTTPYTQTIFNFMVHNNGQLVIDVTRSLMYVNSGTMNITIPIMKLEEMKQYLFNIIGMNIHALYYKVPHTGFPITVKLRNNYDMHVMFDIFAAQGKLEIYIDHVGVNFIIAKYICPNATLAEMMNHVITDYTSDSEDKRKEVTQTDYTYDQMVEWAEHEHLENVETKEVRCHEAIWKNHRFTRRRTEINRLKSLPDHPLIDYGRYALERMAGADMRNTTSLKMARDELLRSMEEKQEFIKNYKEM
ncbi:hypothetical protein Tco_1247495 [Tanacetum coccineum]